MYYRRFAPLFDLQSLGSRATLPAHDLVEVDNSRYRLTMAATGLRREDLEVETHANRLHIRGKSPDETEARFVHRGLRTPSLEATFELAPHVEVTDARLENGLLHIELVRELPDALQPRTITVKSTEAARNEPALEAA